MIPFDPNALPVTGEVQQVADAVWRIVAPNPGPLTGPGTNTYVIGRERPVVIDPGCDEPAHLSRVLGIAGGRIERILCTHSHPDHSPGASWLREITGARVLGLAQRFRRAAVGLGLQLPASPTPIQPVILGSESAALDASHALRARGLWVPAIRPPTAPRRLRRRRGEGPRAPRSWGRSGTVGDPRT